MAARQMGDLGRPQDILSRAPHSFGTPLPMTTSVVISIIVGSCFGGFISGIAGFAFGLVALSFWVWQIDPKLLAPMVVFGSFVAQTLSVGAVRRSFDWKRMTPFLIGGTLGVPVGVALLGVVNVTMFRLFTGVILIIFCSSMLFLTDLKPIAAGGRWADGVSGLVGGIMGGLAGLTGPAPTLWCTVRGWDKDTQRCIFQTFNLGMQAIALVTYWLNGTLTPTVGKVFALMLPALLIPTVIGARLYKRINAVAFRKIVLGLLLLSGVVLLVSTLFGKH
jgi:uncharacterized membrane protein YfcA